MFERIKHMIIKEFIQIFRNPRMKTVIFIAPLFQTFVFGYAATTDVKHVNTAVYDLDNSAASRDLVARFAKSGYFDIVEYVANDARVEDMINRGEALAVLRMNKGFEADIKSGKTAHLQVILDGTDSNTAGIVLHYSSRIALQYSREISIKHTGILRGALRQPGRAELETRAWFNENLESRNFYLPGVIALIVTLITLMLTSMAVVREKEIGTIEQIMVTPITPAEFIIGKCLPFAIIGFIDIALIAAIGVFWFDIPMRGSVLTLFLGAALYLLSAQSVGLLLSTISQTQQQAMMSAFFFIFPAMLLSGFMFPIANMPEPIQWLTLLNPLRYFMVIIRGIFLKGIGLDALWTQMAALLLLGSAALWLAVRQFKKPPS